MRIFIPVFIPREWKASVLVTFAMATGFLIMPLIFAFRWDDHKLDQRLTEEGKITRGRITSLTADCSEVPCYDYRASYEIRVDGETYSTQNEALYYYDPAETEDDYYEGGPIEVLYLADDPAMHRVADNPPDFSEDWHLLFLAAGWGVLPGMVFKPKRDYAKFRYVENDVFHLRFVILPIATIAWVLLTAEHDRPVLLYTLAYGVILAALGVAWADIHRMRKRKTLTENAIRELVIRDFTYPVYLLLFLLGLFFIPFLQTTPFQIVYIVAAFIGAWRLGQPHQIYFALMQRRR